MLWFEGKKSKLSESKNIERSKPLTKKYSVRKQKRQKNLIFFARVPEKKTKADVSVSPMPKEGIRFLWALHFKIVSLKFTSIRKKIEIFWICDKYFRSFARWESTWIESEVVLVFGMQFRDVTFTHFSLALSLSGKPHCLFFRTCRWTNSLCVSWNFAHHVKVKQLYAPVSSYICTRRVFRFNFIYIYLLSTFMRRLSSKQCNQRERIQLQAFFHTQFKAIVLCVEYLARAIVSNKFTHTRCFFFLRIH